MVRINWAEPLLDEDDIREVTEAIARDKWIGGNGPRVRELERQITLFTGARHAVAVSNGTCALLTAMLALRAKGYKLHFLAPTLTFYATGATARLLGRLRLADSDRFTWNIKTDRVPNDTDIIVPVDICGLPADYDTLRENGRFILADSAQSFGSTHNGRPVGSQADIHTFSFHSAKVFTTGEGGAITTNNTELYEEMKAIVNQGYKHPHKPYEYTHDTFGLNFRMSELHAAIGLAQLRKLPALLEDRRRKARIYMDILGDKVEYQATPPNTGHNYFIFAILTHKPASHICEHLLRHGIAAKQLWKPLHKQTPLATKGKYPTAEYISTHTTMLPIHANMTEEQVKEVATRVLEATA